MKKIAIASHKGGVGKTTTSINLSAGLANHGKKVLLIDIDHQANASYSFSINTENALTIADLLINDRCTAKDVIQKTYIENLDIIPSDISLLTAEIKLPPMGREFRLRKKLAHLTEYDYIIIDCPPNFGLLTINAFMVAHEIIMPIHLAIYDLTGINTFLEFLAHLNDNLGNMVSHRIDMIGIIVNLFELRTRLSKDIFEKLKNIFEVNTFITLIPQNIKLKESQVIGKSIFDYDPECSGSLSYQKLVQEIIKRG